MNASPLNNFKSSTLKVLHSQWSDDLELSWGAWRGDHSGPVCQHWWPLRPRPGARSRTPAQSRSPEPPGICWHTWTWHLPLKPSNRQSSYRASKYDFLEFSKQTNVHNILCYQVIVGAGRAPWVLQVRLRRSPGDTETGGEVMYGPEGIAGEGRHW